jgi:Flp pilus assembly protein TadG
MPSLKGHPERGAAAVEMALVLPLLLLIIFALVDFGRAFNTKIQLSQAAREGVRLVAMHSPSNVAVRVQQAAPSLTIPPSYVVIQYLDSSGNVVSGDCSTAGVVNAKVTVTTDFTWITGLSQMSRFFGPDSLSSPTQQSAVGVMQCT